MIVDQQGNKLHAGKLRCAQSLGITYEEVTDAIYGRWRSVMHMLNYGASAATIKKNLNERMQRWPD